MPSGGTLIYRSEFSETASIALGRCTVRSPRDEGITDWVDGMDANSALSLPVSRPRPTSGSKCSNRFTRLLRGTVSKSLKVPLSRPQIPEPLLPPRIKSQQRKITLQRASLQALLDKRYEDAENFIHKGADVNSRGDIGHLLLQNGEALLHRAAHRQNTGVTKFLLDRGRGQIGSHTSDSGRQAWNAQ